MTTKVTKIDIPSKPKSSKNDSEEGEIPIKIAPETRIRLIKMFRLLLTLFYGQFIANAIYSNIIHGLPQLIEKPDQYYPILRVTLGVCMLALAVLAVVAVTLKFKFSWLLIFISGIILVLLSIAALIIDIIDIVQRRERKILVGSEFGSAITELIVENLFRTCAVVVTFFMGKFIHGFNDYLQVSTNDDTNKA
jgi:hypothetical protein